jgi:hypothetical protein
VDSIFRTRALTAAINQMRPVRTRVLDRVFPRKKRQLTDRFAWDIKSSNERLLSNIRVEAPAEVQDKTGRKTVTCEAPRYSPKRFISAGDLNAMRAHGTQDGPELLKERVADEQFDMRGDVDRTREFQAVKAIQGTVVDKTGATIVDYNFPAAQKPVLAGAALWTDAGSDPLANIRAWKKLIADEHAVDGFAAFCGSGAMDAMLNNSALLELLKYTVGKQVADEGRIAHLAGVQIDEYFGTYKTDAGVRTQLMPDDAFILVGLGPDVAAELYAPVVDLKAPGGVGSGQAASVFFSKSWEVEDPSGRWIKAEARPLPVLFRPGCVVHATVI